MGRRRQQVLRLAQRLFRRQPGATVTIESKWKKAFQHSVINSPRTDVTYTERHTLSIDAFMMIGETRIYTSGRVAKKAVKWRFTSKEWFGVCEPRIFRKTGWTSANVRSKFVTFALFWAVFACTRADDRGRPGRPPGRPTTVDDKDGRYILAAVSRSPAPPANQFLFFFVDSSAFSHRTAQAAA